MWSKTTGPVTSPPPEDDLLRRLKAELNHDVAGNARRTLKRSNQFMDNVWEGVRFLGGVAHFAFSMAAAGKRALSLTPRPLKFCFNQYARAWNWMANKTDNDGDKVFSLKGATMMVAATALAGVIAVNAIPEAGRSTLYFAWWAATNKTEDLYCNKSTDAQTGVHKVQCSHAWPPTSENTIDFAVDDSAFHDIHRIITHGELFYPSLIAGAVPDVPSKCSIDYYGSRGKIFARWGNYHPRLMEVRKCEPLDLIGTNFGSAVPTQVSPPATNTP
jgi:hypothetical protein